jgi:thioredoxin-related protein
MVGQNLLLIKRFLILSSPSATLNNHLSDLKGRYNTNTIAVALYPDKTSPEHITKTSKKNGWKLPLFFDVYDDAHTLYRIKEIPHLMVVDKEGNLVYEKRGYSPEFYTELEDALKELNP